MRSTNLKQVSKRLWRRYGASVENMLIERLGIVIPFYLFVQVWRSIAPKTVSLLKENIMPSRLSFIYWLA